MDGAPRLLHVDELDDWGYTFRARAKAIREGLLIPLRAGVFANGEDWHASTPEQQIVGRAQALARVSRVPPVFSHETAAAMHDLPLFSPEATVLHATVPLDRPGAAAGVIRHRGELTPEEVVTIDGLSCTSIARTVADMSRTAAFEKAVTVADAALRRLCTSRRGDYDLLAAEQFRGTVREIVRRSSHGQSRSERVMAFSDGRAQRPGESVSRIRLHALGFRSVRLQVGVRAPHGPRDYAVDFALDQAHAFGEFDGRIKYHDGRFTLDRSADEVFDLEKQREDWIRGVTGRKVVRWGWPHITTPEALGTRLAAFGVFPAAR
jgi:hypothetical protein